MGDSLIRDLDRNPNVVGGGTVVWTGDVRNSDETKMVDAQRRPGAHVVAGSEGTALAPTSLIGHGTR